MYGPNNDEENLKKFFTDYNNKFNIKLSEIDKYMKGKKFSVGGYLTYVDIYFYVNFTMLNAMTTKLGCSILDKCINIKEIWTNIKGMPEI